MRKATIAALAGATAFVVVADFTRADTSLFYTTPDFGGSKQLSPNPYTGYPSEPTETGYQGFGNYSNTTSGVAHFDSLGNAITYQTTSLANPTTTVGVNGLGDIDNLNPPSGSGRSADANLGTGWAGYHAPIGSMTVVNYQGASELESNGGPGGYDVISSGEMISPQGTASGNESTASVAFINALANGKAMAIDFTAPGGGTTLVPDGMQTTSTTPYYILDFGTQDSNGGFNGGGGDWVNPGFNVSNKDPGNYGDDPGSFVVTHGTGASSYWTAYLPYSYAAAATATYLQFQLILNADGYVGGNVTIDNIRTVSPTWAGPGSGLSWTTNVSPENTDWIGGLPGGAVGGASGASATMADIETGNATTTLDATWTLGLLTFNSLLYTYNIAPGTGGSLVMDNKVNGTDAAIADVAGGSATSGGGTASNYTEYVTANVQLNSNTDVSVTRSTDLLDITGNITGTGALSMAGAGTLQLYGSNTYSGGTTVTGGTLLVSSTGALPAGKPVSVTGATLEINNLATNSPTPPPPNMTITGLTMSGGALRLDSTDSGPFVQMNGSTVTMSSTVTLAGSLSISSTSVTIAGGTLQLATNVTAGSQSANTPVTAPASNVTLSSLAISGNGTLDIGNNHIIINYGGGSDPIASIAKWIADGAYGTGTTVTWTGTGITSSAAASNPSYGIGYADASDSGNPAGLAAGQIEIMYTLLGDANLDGKVNGSDFNLMATNFNQAVTAGWDKGDFNYDGKVNGNDFVLLAANFNQFASQSSVSSADAAALDAFAAANGISLNSVPEPASAGLLAVGVVSMLGRRRRKNIRS
jgi:autotransporter-associated beta strand protein